MNNTERIQDFLEEYAKFLKANNIDVAHSVVNDEWFVYCYEKDYGHYEYFIKFETVEQLIDIILKEMAFNLNLFLDEEIAPPDCEEDPELADRIDRYRKEGKAIPTLVACLERISENDLANNVDFFDALRELLNYK